jgi:hypothetical protein
VQDGQHRSTRGRLRQCVGGEIVDWDHDHPGCLLTQERAQAHRKCLAMVALAVVGAVSAAQVLQLAMTRNSVTVLHCQRRVKMINSQLTQVAGVVSTRGWRDPAAPSRPGQEPDALQQVGGRANGPAGLGGSDSASRLE